MSQSEQETVSLSSILERMVDKTDGDEVSLKQLFGTLANRSFGPLLLIPAIIAVSPVGAIPGMSMVTGAIIFLVSAQILAFRSHPWLPERLMSFRFTRERFKSSVSKLKPYVERAERVLTQRLTILTQTPFTQVTAAVCLTMAMLMFPLALIPFAVFLPGMAVLSFGLGMTMKDGLLIASGYAMAALSLWFSCAWL